MRWLRDRFLRRHPQDKALAFASLNIPGQWERSCSSDSTPSARVGSGPTRARRVPKRVGRPGPTYILPGFLTALARTISTPSLREGTSPLLVHSSSLLPCISHTHKRLPNLTKVRISSLPLHQDRGVPQRVNFSSTTARSGSRSLCDDPPLSVEEVLALPPGVGAVPARPAGAPPRGRPRRRRPHPFWRGWSSA